MMKLRKKAMDSASGRSHRRAQFAISGAWEQTRKKKGKRAVALNKEWI
jgi:hypothetical protein